MTAKKYHATRHFELKHLPNIPAACQICNKVYKNATSRDEHCLKHHGLTKEMMKRATAKEVLDPIDVDPNYMTI